MTQYVSPKTSTRPTQIRTNLRIARTLWGVQIRPIASDLSSVCTAGMMLSGTRVGDSARMQALSAHRTSGVTGTGLAQVGVRARTRMYNCLSASHRSPFSGWMSPQKGSPRMRDTAVTLRSTRT